MALLNLRIDGDPILRKISKEVTKFDDKLKALADDMLETMKEEEGVGLAAVQVGRLKRMITYVNIEDDSVHVLVNPEILSEEGSVTDTEGCLSVPGKTGQVERPETIKVKGQNLQGEVIEFEAKDYLARVLCHEIDHLNGILYTDTATDVVEV